MRTYLLTWNPKSWTWDTLAKESEKVRRATRPVKARWSCGNTLKIRSGDRFFLLRQGTKEPTGIIGSGYFESQPFPDYHWEPARARKGHKALYAKIRFETLLNSTRNNILPRRLLKSDPILSNVHWDTQRSGIEIPEAAAAELELLWSEFSGSLEFALPEEIRGSFFEGARREIKVNVYERDPEARQLCIEHYGNRCYVCGFDFDEFYGEGIARGYIHVHHLVPLSEIAKEYQVDPVQDLRPVCPNCHAMIHRKMPAYSIDEIKSILTRRATTKGRGRK